jgi:hypothetical protein
MTGIVIDGKQLKLKSIEFNHEFLIPLVAGIVV